MSLDEMAHDCIVNQDFRGWIRKQRMAAAHIVRFPIDIDQICARLENGEETYKIALEIGESNAMIAHYYRAYRGKSLSEARGRLRGKQRKIAIDAG